jgi:hypothetical protein
MKYDSEPKLIIYDKVIDDHTIIKTVLRVFL